MAATKPDIRGWLDRGVASGATHMLVVCDTFDHEDYPVFIAPGENITERAKEFNGVNMQRILECYDLGMDLDAQLGETLAFHGWRPQWL